MQLKKLEMCGFKSFANRTEVVFDRGITGIVGPNGCGKSNVVDAIKWVLGTLSYKSVRGEEMLDVIFKGAQGVAAMGFAEVSLTLDNSDHTLAIEFEEVTITRRLFSTGEGEYYINRAPCRLRDIRELLYGTGIGTDNYSIIEQGKIDKLVLSNPHERRLVFDEAAGISKYRAKKRETEHRLEKVQQDLLRIQDRHVEVQKQLRSVRAQAGRATRYKELTEEFKSKRKRFFLHEHRSLAVRGAEIAARLGALEESRRTLQDEIEARARAAGEAGKRLGEETARHGELGSSLATLESKASYLEKSIGTAHARCTELETEIQRIAGERASHEAREREIAGIVAQETRGMEELDAQARVRAEQAEEARRQLEDATRECARTMAELDSRKAEAVELAHKEAQYRNERDRLQKDAADLEVRAAEARTRSVKLAAELAELRARIDEARAAREAIEGEIAGLVEQKRSEEAEQARLREERGRLERDLGQLREGREHRVARRETLRDLEEQFEGLETGAKALLRERPEGVLGSVADVLEVAAENVAAVEGALGDRAGAVVCETRAHAERAAEIIRERGLGRTTLISLDECRNGYFSDVELLTPGVIGRASALVKSEERYGRMVGAILGHTLLVRDRDAAGEIRRDGLTEWPLVTPEGDLFDHPGIATTGGAKGVPGLISRKAELRRLGDEIDEYLALISQREARFADVETRLKACDEKIERLRQRAYEKSVAAGERSAQVEQIAVREQFLSGERETTGAEIEAMVRQAAAVADRVGALVSLLAELAGMKERVAQEIAALGQTQERYERGKAELQDALANARVESAKADEQRASAEKRLEMHRASRQESARALEGVASRLAEATGRLDGAAEEARSFEAERETLSREVAAARQRLAECARLRDERAAASESARAEESRTEAELSPCEEELNRLRVEEEGHRVKAETILQRAREEMEIDLAAEAAAAPAEEGADWEALGREIDELRVKIAGFGAVNIVALDQMAELEESDKFIAAQQEDLVKAKSQLEDLIRQLNKESRELFEKTIDFVREQFSTIFRKIFGGGKADIILEQAEGIDPMEQGLEIMARPPGKELTSISLLSGGERSLTAIALVMALFKANPGPFCLLDEADAALDEKNVERYAGVVREFASDTQFIVITHNKRSMAVCDALYGITMEQQGVSKKVSVDLSGDQGLDLLKAKGGAPVPAPTI
jgi:chromosome segregation protein